MLELKKGNIRMLIEEPQEGYQGPRFDWTGKINQFWYNDISFCTEEIKSGSDQEGRGFFNEFGMNDPIGYEECKVGEYFPKVGIGLLKRWSEEAYDFFYPYEIKPFEFCISRKEDSFTVQCLNKDLESAIYLEKEIALTDDGFIIKYNLENIGNNRIETSEYVHNFLSINSENLSKNMRIQFQGGIDNKAYLKGLNPDQAVIQFNNSLSWNKTPASDFFFENIARPNEGVNWILFDEKLRIQFSEEVDFVPAKTNLWGRTHVVSPELFKLIHLGPGESEQWQRKFKVTKY